MAKKYEFQPDKPYSTWLNKLQLTPLQQRQVLKWALYTLLLIILSVLQDVVLCRMRIYGGTTDLVPCGIFLICILEGSHKGCVFSLVAAIVFLLSGSSPGAHVLVLITVPAIFVTILRQTYLQPGFPSALLCSLLAMIAYELGVFAFCMLLGLVTPDRYLTFAVPAALSVIATPVIYPFAKLIGSIGGELWKE